MNNRSRHHCRPGFQRLYSIAAGCLLFLLLAPIQLQAEEESASAVAEDNQVSILGTLGKATKLSASDLDEHRAKAKLEVHKITINDQELNGIVTGNTAVNTQTGDNIVSTGAFNATSGFVSTVQNSGNNVLIQNSTIINVEIDP